MQPIYSRTLSNIAYTVTFNNIPQTFTDLCLVISARTDWNGLEDGETSMFFNGQATGTNYSRTTFNMTSTAAPTGARTGNVEVIYTGGGIPAATSFSNTFGILNVYIPNYTSSNFKAARLEVMPANNTSGTTRALTAGLWRSTSPITSISFYGGAGNFTGGSTFHLYGILKQ